MSFDSIHLSINRCSQGSTEDLIKPSKQHSGKNIFTGSKKILFDDANYIWKMFQKKIGCRVFLFFFNHQMVVNSVNFKCETSLAI